MDLSYTDEQRLLQESANNLLAARAAKAGTQDIWTEIAGLGWLGLPLPEADGGLGQSTVDVAIVTEAMGRHLVSAPLVSNVVLGGGLVAGLGTEAQRAALLPALAEGKARLALAHAEEGARYDLRHVATKAMRESDGWTLHGRKLAVLAGGEADRLLVSARLAGTTRDAQRVGLFLVDPRAAGVTVEAYPTVDGGGAARVTLDKVAVGADAAQRHALARVPARRAEAGQRDVRRGGPRHRDGHVVERLVSHGHARDLEDLDEAAERDGRVQLGARVEREAHVHLHVALPAAEDHVADVDRRQRDAPAGAREQVRPFGAAVRDRLARHDKVKGAGRLRREDEAEERAARVGLRRDEERAVAVRGLHGAVDGRAGRRPAPEHDRRAALHDHPGREDIGQLEARGARRARAAQQRGEQQEAHSCARRKPLEAARRSLERDNEGQRGPSRRASRRVAVAASPAVPARRMEAGV